MKGLDIVKKFRNYLDYNIGIDDNYLGYNENIENEFGIRVNDKCELSSDDYHLFRKSSVWHLIDSFCDVEYHYGEIVNYTITDEKKYIEFKKKYLNSYHNRFGSANERFENNEFYTSPIDNNMFIREETNLPYDLFDHNKTSEDVNIAIEQFKDRYVNHYSMAAFLSSYECTKRQDHFSDPIVKEKLSGCRSIIRDQVKKGYNLYDFMNRANATIDNNRTQHPEECKKGGCHFENNILISNSIDTLKIMESSSPYFPFVNMSNKLGELKIMQGEYTKNENFDEAEKIDEEIDKLKETIKKRMKEYDIDILNQVMKDRRSYNSHEFNNGYGIPEEYVGSFEMQKILQSAIRQRDKELGIDSQQSNTQQETSANKQSSTTDSTQQPNYNSAEGRSFSFNVPKSQPTTQQPSKQSSTPTSTSQPVQYDQWGVPMTESSTDTDYPKKNISRGPDIWKNGRDSGRGL